MQKVGENYENYFPDVAGFFFTAFWDILGNFLCKSYNNNILIYSVFLLFAGAIAGDDTECRSRFKWMVIASNQLQQQPFLKNSQKHL